RSARQLDPAPVVVDSTHFDREHSLLRKRQTRPTVREVARPPAVSRRCAGHTAPHAQPGLRRIRCLANTAFLPAPSLFSPPSCCSYPSRVLRSLERLPPCPRASRDP